MTKVVIGVDGGTTAVKAVAFDLEGNIRSAHHEAVPVLYGRDGEAEQDMNQIWEAVATCLREVTNDLQTGEIIGVGLTGQGDGAWLVDAEGNPARPAATWLDGRASGRVDEWEKAGKGKEVLEVTGTTLFGGLFPVLIEELLETEPAAVAAATCHLNCKDWIRFKLTDERITDYTEASRSFLDVRDTSGFSQELIDSLGLQEVQRLLPEIRPAWGEPALSTNEAEELTGVPAGTPVGIGMIDVAVTGMALDAVADGDSWLILGTTGFVGTLLPNVQDRKSDLSMVLATGRDTQVLDFMAPMTGTPNLDWIRKVLNLQNTDWSQIEEAARQAKPGSHGVTYLPYASPGGERAPFLDGNASASWQGMSLTSTREDILRAVYEGVAFSLVECIDQLEIDKDLIVSGGGFRSDLLCEILADATGKRVNRQDAPEAGARGAAVLALVSAGEYQTVHEAATALGATMQSFEPNPDNFAVYRQAFDLFTAVRKALQPLWKEMRNLRQETRSE